MGLFVYAPDTNRQLAARFLEIASRLPRSIWNPRIPQGVPSYPLIIS